MSTAMYRGIILLSAFVLLAACGREGRTDTPTAPSATRPASSPNAPQGPGSVMAGHVFDATTGAPVAGAIVSIDGRYRATTDESGAYTVTGAGDFTYVSASGYESDYRFIGRSSQDFRLYPIERINAGESTALTVTSDDSLCVNNVQDIPDLGPSYRCHAVRVVATSAGLLTIDVVSQNGNAHPPVEVETTNGTSCCAERIQNPTSLPVTPGLEVVVRVEVPWESTTAQSFVVNTSIKPE